MNLREKNEARKKEFGTLDNSYTMFPVGTRVRVICLVQDFYFFNGDETGVVLANSGGYLVVIGAGK